MEKLLFDDEGRFIGVEGGEKAERENIERKKDLKTSDSLGFLNEEPRLENIFEREFWDFNINGEKIEPLKFSNGKTQEDVVKEIINLIKEGNKIILLHGTCGTGKSAIALNLARVLGKTSIVVPVKALQKQYEDDYMGNTYLIKANGEKMKIAMITGKQNHDSVFWPDVPCSDPLLPENIKISEGNYGKLVEYYKENPLIENKEVPNIENIRRISVAAANPYWSPILPASFEVNLPLARKIQYKGANGKDYIFYHRKRGCSYYDQYLSYTKADIIIFNAAKYKAEIAIGRKPMTEIEIIDEADEFLDSLFQQKELNLSRFRSSLRLIHLEHDQARETQKKIIELINLEEKNKKALGIDENQVFRMKDTNIFEILQLLKEDNELGSDILMDELNYCNQVLEISRNFERSMEDAYLTYRKEEDNIYVKIVSTNLSGKMLELMNMSKAIVFMSGTLHSESVLRNVFGIKDFKVVEAETMNQGNIEILMSGKEFDCKYANFSSNKHSREEYLDVFEKCLELAERPTLIHVNAFRDLPSENENHGNIISSEELRRNQNNDKVGEEVSLFKEKKKSLLFTTKCSRGVDFPGDVCRSIIFTKYPNPNVQDTFWKILKETHPDYFWEFYKDKARREFLQRIYRALRSPEDHVYVLSPDLRVLDAVRKLQNN